MKQIKKIRCNLSLEEVNVLDLTRDILSGQLSNDKLIVCENKNADILKNMGFENILFFAERDSSSVFIQVKTTIDRFGLRDRDFLLDAEIEKIRSRYPNYYILDYYCFENYLYHPANLNELNLKGLKRKDYEADIILQKNQAKNQIISIFRNSRNSYQEFKIESEKLRIKKDESQIIKYLESDDIEIFFKAFSMKDYFNKEMISKYNLKKQELGNTKWIKAQFKRLLNIE